MNDRENEGSDNNSDQVELQYQKYNNISRQFKKVLFDIEEDLWTYLVQGKNIIFEITDWDRYRRAAEFIKSPSEKDKKPNYIAKFNYPRAITVESLNM